MDVIAVGDVALVGDPRDDAPTPLQGLRELVGGRLDRRPIEAVVNVLRGLPFSALVIHVLHDDQGERRPLVRVCVAFSGHVLHALIEAGVAE